MGKVFAGVALAALSVAGVPAGAAEEEAAVAARAFGAREGIADISLSPDGTRIAMVVPAGPRGDALLIADPLKGGEPRRILTASGTPDHLRGCDWVTNERLVCRVYIRSRASGALEGYTRLVSLDAAGGNFKVVTARAGDRTLYDAYNGGTVIDWTGDGKGGLLVTRQFVPDRSIGTLISSDARGLGVERVDVASLARRTVERAKGDAVEYITDGVGTVRVMGQRPTSGDGYQSNFINYFYRKRGEEAWQPLGRLAFDGGAERGFNPYAVDPALDAVYGFDDHQGRRALFRIALDGSMKRELVLANPKVDVDGLLQIGRQRRVVGGSFAMEHREATFFDPGLAKLSVALGRALPKQPIVSFVDASADEKRLLLYAGSDVDAGRYYLYDKATRRLAEVLPSRPELDGRAMGTMTPVTFPAADGTMIPGYLTLPAGSDGKGLPAIVMPHGGPGARDEWGFDWWVQFFASRGFAVLQPNFRGSAGYGANWLQNNGFQSWRTAIGDVNDAGRWLVKQGIARADRLAIVGWSYGGYAALQSPALDPALYKAIVAVAPVTDLAALKSEAARYANYQQVRSIVGEGPHIREGSPVRNAAAIRVPVLLFHGDEDQNVDVSASQAMRSALRDAGKKVEFVEYKGLAHSLEDSAARADMLAKSDAFLRASLGM